MVSPLLFLPLFLLLLFHFFVDIDVVVIVLVIVVLSLRPVHGILHIDSFFPFHFFRNPHF